MRMLLKPLLALLLLATPAVAEEFARTTAATQLVDRMNELYPFDESIRQNVLVMLAPLFTKVPCPERLMPSIEKTLKALEFKAMRSTFIRAYAETFDYSELNLIRAFYDTPAGTKLLRLQPQMSAILQQETAKRLEGKLDQLTKDITALAKDKTCQAAIKNEEKITP